MPNQLCIISFFLLISFFVLHCNNFPPTFPAEEPEKKTVIIEHINTEYLPMQALTEGLVASKVNIVSFRIQAQNFEAKSLEIFGRVILEGPPEKHTHCIHFYTDQIGYAPEKEGFSFNMLESIKPESIYTLVRYKYPTNEYAPFQDDQGMINEIKITEVWAVNESGEKETVLIKNVIDQ